MSDDLSPQLRVEVKRSFARVIADRDKLRALASRPEAIEKLGKTLGLDERETIEALEAAERQMQELILNRKFPGWDGERWVTEATEPAAAPHSACFLLDLFLAKADRAVMPGDIIEEFKEKLAVYTPKRARLWFWAETGRVIMTRNPVCRCLLGYGFGRLIEWFFRTIGS